MRYPGHVKSILRTLTRAFRPRRKVAGPAAFAAVFDLFKKVLDSNNRALEAITDMGEKLGGDYLFDIVYVRKAYALLRDEMENSLRLFHELVRERYAPLTDRFLEIDGRIRHVIDETVSIPQSLVVSYENITDEMKGAVGGKNSNLAEVRNAVKLRVPDAFAVTTRAFDAFMRENGVFEKASLPAAGSPVPEATLHELRELVLHGAIPAELGGALEKAVRKIRSRCGGNCALAVRSSAGEEDGEHSFAGQFETVLNVPLESRAVEHAYRTVLASLFSDRAAAYQARLGYDIRGMKMSVACVVMVDAVASGVAYSSSPHGDRNTLVINAAWGLGTSIVEGQTDADLFRVSRDNPREIVETRVGAKEIMVVPGGKGGVESIATPLDRRNQPSLSADQVSELARQAIAIERHFRKPQDIEWALDRDGSISILQARPLRAAEGGVPGQAPAPAAADGQKIIARVRGAVVQKGAAAGTVFILRNDRDIPSIPKGAVLVARRDSSQYVRVMTGVSAILTDTGTPTSHMATLCREFRIPTVVNTGNATRLLEPGQEVTVVADDDGATVYQGAVGNIVDRGLEASMRMEALNEFRKRRYLLRYISPLNLVDPLRDEFTPKACRTMHDILRFIHEKSVAELIEGAGSGIRSGAVRLDLPVPAGIMLIDIGGGLDNPEGLNTVTAGQVASIPLRAIIAGMTRPGLWRSDAVPLRVNDFMASMLRVPDITTDAGGRVEQNMAVISREYANISLKFGYHFIVVDCFCGEKAKNNHIYFRFAGGATDMTRRSRRLQFISAVLEEYGFGIRTKGDLIVARLANVQQAEAEVVLDQVGRLFSYTRQLDAVLKDDRDIGAFAQKFMNGNYELAGSAVSQETRREGMGA